MKEQVKEILLKQLQLLQQASENHKDYVEIDSLSQKSMAMAHIAHILIESPAAD